MSDGQLARMTRAYEEALAAYIKDHPVYWTDRFGFGGTLNNLEVGLTWMTSLGKTGLARGCLACQSKTIHVLQTFLGGEPEAFWIPARIVVGRGFEHHAVAVYRKGTGFTEGLVFDPWIDQAPRVYPYESWLSKMWKLRAFGSARME